MTNDLAIGIDIDFASALAALVMEIRNATGRPVAHDTVVALGKELDPDMRVIRDDLDGETIQRFCFTDRSSVYFD